jgi:hypothetical protein
LLPTAPVHDAYTRLDGVPNRAKFEHHSDSGAVCQDKFWLALWFSKLMLFVGLAVHYGKSYVAPTSTSGSGTDGLSAIPFRNIILAVVYAFFTALAVAFIWIEAMKKSAGSIISICFKLYLFLLGALAAVCFALVNTVTAGMLLVMMTIQMLWWWCVSDRIPFSEAILSASVHAISENSGTIWVGYGLVVVQVGWSAFWAYTATVTLQAMNLSSTTYTNNFYGITVLFVLAFLWTSWVIRYIGVTTSAGAYDLIFHYFYLFFNLIFQFDYI